MEGLRFRGVGLGVEAAWECKVTADLLGIRARTL